MTLKPYHTKGIIEAGCDEAGRGCLAGPVFAAAVILPTDFYHPLLNDSKKLKEKVRNELREYIEKNALDYAVVSVDAAEIDKINILNASIEGMRRALGKLTVGFDEILVDGNRFKSYGEKKHHCIIKGDGKYSSIAAASVLAKTYRDEYMKRIHLEYPVYGWDKNMGYPSKRHRDGILEYGSCRYHRMSFRLLPGQLSLDF
jgi:ribonuclease HII